MTHASDLHSMCSVSRSEYRGWPTYTLSNGILTLFVFPDVGGRIIQLSFNGHEYLYVNPRLGGKVYPPEENDLKTGWKNYGGSKVWPAPQGWSSDAEWPGPPDPVLDGGRYACQVLENRPEAVSLQLTSPYDEYSGLALERVVQLSREAASVAIVHTMRNCSVRPVRWGIWQVTQQPAGAQTQVFARATEFSQMFGDEPYTAVTLDSKKKILRIRCADVVGKLAVHATSGWLATLQGQSGMALVETFRLFPGAKYPDGAPVEFWNNARGTFTIHGDKIDLRDTSVEVDSHIETEILSPWTELEPGQEYSFRIQWNCCAMDADAIVDVNFCAAVGDPLRVQPVREGLRVTGSFGLFHFGRLELVTILRDGAVVEINPAGAASPLDACRIDQTIPTQAGVARVSLRLRDKEGKLLGTISHANIP